MTQEPRWWGDPGCYAVADGVFRIPLSMPNDGLRAVNVYAVESGDSLVLVDGGWAVGTAAAELDAALAAVGRSAAQISDVYVTHVHRDHYTFAVRLREMYGTRVHLGRLERPGLEAVRALGSNVPQSSLRELRRSGAARLANEIDAAIRPTPFDIEDWSDPDAWLDPGPLDVAGRRLEVVSTPGHTKGHVVLHDVERRLLFSGDHVLPTITPSIGFELGPWDLPLAHFLASLRLLLERPDARLMPAHGFEAQSTHRRVEELLAHHEHRFEQIRGVMRGIGAEVEALAVASRLPWTRRQVGFADLDSFNRMIAVCETIAHLDVLAHEHEIAVRDVEGVAVFGR